VSNLARHAVPRRLVVVGNPTATDRLTGLLIAKGLEVKAVPDYLSALGEVTREPTAALIGPMDSFPGDSVSVLEGFRELSPETKLVAWCGSSDVAAAETAARAGFDHLISGPADASGISALMPDESDRDGEEQRQPPPSSEQAVLYEEQPPLGDVDMVQSLLEGGDKLREIALKIVAANSGIHGIGLCMPGEQPPASGVSAAVNYAGRCLGHLYAPPPATPEALAGWSDWLASWLALGGRVSELSDQAMRDDLTGIWNRRYFNCFLGRILNRAAADRSQVTLLIFDIDDFKLYNDAYGHGMGDEVLRETARLMLSVVREHDVVARIGGDEFAVIFWDHQKPRKPNSEHPQDVVAAARRFQEAICSHRFPKLLDKAPGRLTVSGGLACFPWDGRTPEELVTRADAMALQSKRQGKNAITFGTGEKRPCPEP
jgi:diguanylate cyclase (GGDEF)-like protein